MTLQVLDIRGRTAPVDIGTLNGWKQAARERNAMSAHDNYKAQLTGIAAGMDAGTYDPATAQELANKAYRDSGFSNFDEPDANGATLHQRSVQALFGDAQNLDRLRGNANIAVDVPEEYQDVERTQAEAGRQAQYGNNDKAVQLHHAAAVQALPHLNATVQSFPGADATPEQKDAFAKQLTVDLVPFRQSGVLASVVYDPQSDSYVSSVNGQAAGSFKTQQDMIGLLNMASHPDQDGIGAAYATQVKGANDRVAAAADTAKAARDAKLEVIKKAADVLGKFELPAFTSATTATNTLNTAGWQVEKSVDGDTGSTVLMTNKQGQQVVAIVSSQDGAGGLGGRVEFQTPDGRPVDPDKMGAPVAAMQQLATSFAAMSNTAKTLYSTQFLQFQLNAIDAVTGQGAVALPGKGGAPQASTGDSAVAPRGLRNQNPGNLRPGGHFKGETGSDGGFAQFGTMADGIRAAATNLRTYQQKYGLDTVAGIVQKWAPPGDNNDTGAYVTQVAQQIGVDPNAKLDLSNPQVMTKLLGAIFQHENGQPVDPQLIAAAVGGQDRPNDGLPARPDFAIPGRPAPTQVASAAPAPGNLSPDDITASIANYLRIR